MFNSMSSATVRSLITLALSASLVSAQQRNKTEPLNDQRIADLMRMGVSEQEVLRIIATAPKFDFDLRPISTNALMENGVSEEVIKAMAAREAGGARPAAGKEAGVVQSPVLAPAGASVPASSANAPAMSAVRAQMSSREQARAELQTIRTVFVVGNSEAASALRDKLETYTCLQSSLNPAQADATLTVDESARQSYSVLTGRDNKISASVVLTMPNGDQVWSKNKLGGDGFIHSGAGFATIQILRSLAKSACPDWSTRNEGKPGSRLHRDYQRADR